ncbi:MAG TPA: hypothetical protein DDY14_15680 [Chromatiaceae bacterium]|jgi:apolipoprotein D and lipocalin family protein|nr:MAG: hypothetical protein N838_12590 [Thiohalocapsa sp. PB-PSB1]QQO54343.1 MAG: lipocalin family protein [Thiohalocapsa sp. PB-PSB1]HBG96722.1 hypothetical protein [Chromatiaceae bacterium]HCS88777.1 hypothetical protein [Chromatiaceae bacterium]
MSNREKPDQLTARNHAADDRLARDASVNERPADDQSASIDSSEPLPKPKRGRGRPRGQRNPRRLDAWAQEIYTAPPGERGDTGVDAKVVVSTRMRKPKVHLTAPTTVPWVDLPRYMGKWYEIARLPYFTQRHCVKDVYAEYLLGEDGMMYVTNRCTRKDGVIGQANGLARVVDQTSNSRFEISFRTLYGVHVLWDDYWVVGLGDDYDYALVGQPTRRRGWVLSRTPHPPEQAIKNWLDEFADKGFPAKEFIRTLQET